MKLLVGALAFAVALNVEASTANDYAARYDQCVEQATAAYAIVHSREQKKPKSDILRYIADHEDAASRPMLRRLVHTVYAQPQLDNEAAYNGELVYCMSKGPLK